MENKVQTSKNIPKWIWVLLKISFPGAALFAIEMLYEMTILTSINGPQNIGFTLVHNYPIIFFFFIISLLILCLWIILVFIWSLFNIKMVLSTKKFFVLFGLSVIIVLILSFSQRIYDGSVLGIDYKISSFLDSAASGDIKSINKFLKRGIDINSKNAGRTALMEASLKNKKEIVELLIKNGAEINMSDNSNSTALKDAVIEGNTEIARLLINNGADIDPLKNILSYNSVYYTFDTIYYDSFEIEKIKRKIPILKKQDSLIYILLNNYSKK